MNSFSAQRLVDGPIVHSGLSPSIGNNIQGPSLIRVPDWIQHPLGQYYLYFADHKGSYIRLAYADDLAGPWKIYEPGSLQLENSGFPTEKPPRGSQKLERIRTRLKNVPYPHDILHDLEVPHIASPDVHIDHEQKRIIMYFHGLESFGTQLSRVARSDDGVNFTAFPECITPPYLRVFEYDSYFYGMTMPGIFYRSKDGLSDFEQGPQLFSATMRHAAILVRSHAIHVFWSNVGDAPERILHTPIDIGSDWRAWQTGPTTEVIRPEQVWEGAQEPVQPSMRSVAYGTLNQLRDPAIFEEQGASYLLYTVAGESGIAIAELMAK